MYQVGDEVIVVGRLRIQHSFVIGTIVTIEAVLKEDKVVIARGFNRAGRIASHFLAYEDIRPLIKNNEYYSILLQEAQE